jgi:membrane-associated progesterone receptor component
MSGKFEPKEPVQLDPPKDTPISVEELAKSNGMAGHSAPMMFLVTLANERRTVSVSNAVFSGTDGKPTYVAIKGIVYDVSGNKAYGPEGTYKGELPTLHDFLSWVFSSGSPLRMEYSNTAWIVVFVGKDSTRALALSSLKPEDCVPDWYDLDEKERKVLSDWVAFFSKRYNVVGVVEGATNKEPEGAASGV